MKWKNLTKCRGDDGYTDFQGRRYDKSDYIMETMGEIDMLNAHLGLLDSGGDDFQLMNREIMGLIHSKGTVEFSKPWISILDEILNSSTEMMDELEMPMDGWINYDHHIFVVMCQVRKVERLLCKVHHYYKKKHHACIYGLESSKWDEIIRIYNRMSKVFYCLGVIQQKAMAMQPRKSIGPEEEKLDK